VTDNKQSLIGAANRLKIWEAIQYAKNAGIGKFDMGGYYTGKKADPQKEGINIFKKSFGGDIVTNYIYEKDYSMAYTLAKLGYKKYKAIREGIQKSINRRELSLPQESPTRAATHTCIHYAPSLNPPNTW
jgi:hypothetical protein